jgi:hypothetical protein
MGFGFRKSFGAGPFRFTISPRGVSSSFGVRGARVTAGPRGTFVTISSHGAYYRHRIDAAPPQHRSSPQPATDPAQGPLDSVFQVPVSELAASNQTDLIEKLNRNISATNPSFIPIVLSCGAIVAVHANPILSFFILISGIILAAMLSKRFNVSHTQEIHYDLDRESFERYSLIQKSLSTLASNSRIWVINTSSTTSDLKRNAGATALITRNPASVGALPTKGFKPSLPISSIKANGVTFHFLPDQVLIFSGNHYASVQYQQLSFSVKASRYIESEAVPRDSQQIDTTWRFVNKNGSPDRRFNNNRAIPVLLYGEVTLQTLSGTQVILQASNLGMARAFISQYSSAFSNEMRDSAPREKTPETPRTANNPLSQYYEILGITPTATAEQANAAFHKKAALYHPDKYEHLAPEMKELAPKKMAEINEAYSFIKRNIGK